MNAATSSVAWGVYLACSWTWCIGLYLPVPLLERWGWPGFIAFAMPNVLGCAAFGYVVKSRARSEAMVARHRTAMLWFSIVTVGYHMFFIVWLLSELAPLTHAAWAIPAAVAALFASILLGFAGDRAWLALAILVYGVSLASMVLVGFGGTASIQWSGAQTLARLAAVAPLLCFGFLLCPYLDLTFHRALQRSASGHAFAVFGVAFLAMIALTCLIWFPRGPALPALAAAHLLAQCVFTMGAHLREIQLQPIVQARAFVMAASAIGAAALPFVAWRAAGAGESIYLAILVAFYGLLFPAWFAIRVVRRKPGLHRDG